MYVVYIDDAIYCEYKSPVAANLQAKQLIAQGYTDVHVIFDESACSNV